jgi:hypothetical protein
VMLLQNYQGAAPPKCSRFAAYGYAAIRYCTIAFARSPRVLAGTINPGRRFRGHPPRHERRLTCSGTGVNRRARRGSEIDVKACAPMFQYAPRSKRLYVTPLLEAPPGPSGAR